MRECIVLGCTLYDRLKRLKAQTEIVGCATLEIISAVNSLAVKHGRL